jgi:nitrite reductase/ring-hydroxylating ferredoxin subunit
MKELEDTTHFGGQVTTSLFTLALALCEDAEASRCLIHEQRIEIRQGQYLNDPLRSGVRQGMADQ